MRSLRSLLKVKESYIGKILVIDDNLFIRTSIKNLLKEIFFEKNKKYKIIEGSDGVDFLKRIIDDQKKNNKIKCVFTDEKMEYMDGSKVISIIREMEKLNKIKKVNIVSLTCFEDEIYRNYIMESGVDFITKKPSNKDVLQNILDKLNLL